MSDIVKRIPDHFCDFLEDGDFAKFAKREGQMSDIVKWLRSYHKDSAHGALHEAADEIERLLSLAAFAVAFFEQVEAKSITVDSEAYQRAIRALKEKS